MPKIPACPQVLESAADDLFAGRRPTAARRKWPLPLGLWGRGMHDVRRASAVPGQAERGRSDWPADMCTHARRDAQGQAVQGRGSAVSCPP
jgi:hypothetical protein